MHDFLKWKLIEYKLKYNIVLKYGHLSSNVMQCIFRSFLFLARMSVHTNSMPNLANKMMKLYIINVMVY